MRGGCRHSSQMGDGFGDHGVDLHVTAVHREALGAWLPDADAHDGGDACAGFVAVNCQVDRLFKAHIEAEGAAGLHQVEYLLPVFSLEHAIAAVCMRQNRWIGRGGWPVDDLFNEVRKLEVHLLAVCQGQRVAFAVQLNGEERVGLEAVRRQVLAVVKPPAAGGWKDQLARTENGSLIAHMQNVELILGNDERWAGVIGYSVFSSKIVKLRSAPFGGGAGDWADIDDMRVMKWLAQQYNLRVKASHVIEAVSVVAHDHAFHPVREYLEKLEWDRVPRIETWLTDVLGVNASEYSAKVGKRWLISAVARVMRPGCKADSVMILEGGQGAGKSTAMGVLGGEWFMDTPFALGDKDSFQAIRGKWIVELGELDSFNKAESTKAKQFFSASTDTYRESYGRRTNDVPRQCVFVGTTNQEEYLKDATGNRRYWPVFCNKVDLEQLREIRDQLWAEALFCFEAGDIWWVTKDESWMFAEAQDERFVVDEWEGPILAWMEESQIGETATGNEILTQALKLDFGHWGKPEQMRVGAIMHRLGWRKRRMPALPKSGVRPWAYEKPAGWGRASALQQSVIEEPCFD